MENHSYNQAMEPIDKAISLAGNPTRLAKLVGLSQPTVRAWKLREKRIEADNVLKVSAALGYQVTPHELRPDIYPFETDAIPHEFREVLKEGK